MQRIALETAINTPDIALIQGPPGTGKTTVIKAIQERFRELFEAEERQRQRADPEYTTHSPRILISSFQMKLSTTRLPILYREICPQIEKEEELI